MLIHKNIIDALSSLEIQHITISSNDIRKNTAFFAIKGANLDGYDYIGQAISKGVSLIITHKAYHSASPCPILIVEDPRSALAQAAEFLYPNSPEYMVAVTGTNGKTSVVNYFWQICSLLSKKAVAIGTIGVSVQDTELRKAIEASGDVLTTPDIITMRKILNMLGSHDVNYVAFEASSHGIDQKRISGIQVYAAALTNITHDHIDYHGSFEAYREAKLKLFTENLKQDGLAVISTDCNDLDYITSYLDDNKISYITVGQGGDLNIISSSTSVQEQKIDFIFEGKKYSFQTSIVGSFQANNMLVAAMLSVKCGLNFDDIVNILPQLTSVRGRLERVTNFKDDIQVFVDYAHTPDALEKSLLELHKLQKNKLLVLFGCGGDRDKEKRPMMGAIASKIADIVIITDDNPRTENPSMIRDAISQSAPNAMKIGGRKEAIEYAINLMNKGDILLIAGKGHEDYQIIGSTKIPFDDVKIAREILYKN